MTGDGQDSERAFEEFVLSVSPRLLVIARLVCGDEHRAQDLTQQALVAVYRHWGRLREDPFAYARRSVVNANVSWWRKHRREVLTDGEGLDYAVVDGADGLLAARALAAAMSGLTYRERAVVVLRYLEDMTERETAHELGIAVGTVKSTTARALRKLRLSPELATVDAPERAR
ncbi:SigE family RNA polymerase sigma factor [Motilibacter deserti]|uniref:SigE family RNA polymerase sigma factor n=1 Tax=Motilibacter deserti TaxID=2714956 RepID=UPI002F2B44EC